MKPITRFVASAAAVVLAIGAAACTAGARGGRTDDARAFFHGKTMTYVVSTDPGGGYDTYGRLVAKYLGRHLGLATVVVKNIPGGGHVRGLSAIEGARPDGLTLGTFNTGLIYVQLFAAARLNGDLRRLSWIGKAGQEPRVLIVSARSGYRSLDDLRKATRPLLLGTNGVGNESYYDSLLLAHALGLRIKLVFGMASREAQLSMLRGEIEAEIGTASSYKTFLENGYGLAVLRIGDGESGVVGGSVPETRHLTNNDESRAIVDFVGSLTRLMRWTAGPPGIPEDRLAVLREAYMTALRDPALLAEAERLGIPIVAMDGATLAGEIERVLDAPAATAALLASIVDATPR